MTEAPANNNRKPMSRWNSADIADWTRRGDLGRFADLRNGGNIDPPRTERRMAVLLFAAAAFLALGLVSAVQKAEHDATAYTNCIGSGC